MFKPFKTIWSIFRLQKKKNGVLTLVIVLLNSFAAFSEGFSFIFILASFSVLTGTTAFKEEIHFLSGMTTQPFLFFLFGAIGLQILRSGAFYLSQTLLSLLTVNIQSVAQREIFHTIFNMSFSEISELKKGDLLHQVTAPPTFIPMVFDEANRFIMAIFMVLAYILIMAKISLGLTVCILLFFFIAALLQKYLFKAITSASLFHADQIADLSQQTAQSLDGLRQIHIFHQHKEAFSKMEESLNSITYATRRLKKWSALIPALNDSIGVVLVGIALLMGTFFLQNEGEISISVLFIFLTLSYRMVTRLQQMMAAKGIIAYYTGPLGRMDIFLSKKAASPHVMIESSSKPLLKEELRFENVSLTYPCQKEPALKNISLSIPKNQIVALVGLSGAGKSSLIELLVRLYEPDEGKIQIDGLPIKQFDLNAWRSLFGVVSQDPFLFYNTIEENIRFGRQGATRNDIERACQMAGATHFIERLPDKYQTLIGERGYRLSGGERQRIVLAQALVRNPQILLLDEATSHLDSQSEQVIQETLFHLRGKKTFLIVAHRLATIQMADSIYVLEKGRIIESGTHQQLLQQGGRYQTLWNLQT